MKKVISLLLVIIFSFSLASCREDISTKIVSDKKVTVTATVYLNKDEYEALMEAGEDVTWDTSDGKAPKFTDITIDGVEYKKYTETKKYKDFKKYKKECLSDYSSVSTKDLYCTFSGTNLDDTSYPVDVNLTFTMPYKIKLTNGKKIGDYSVEFKSIKPDNKTIYYLTTEKSTAAWTKAKNIKSAIKDNIQKQKVKNTKVANFKIKAKKGKKKIVVKNNSGYAIINDTNVFDNDKKMTSLQIYRKVNKGKYKLVKTINMNKKCITDTIYTDKKVKKGNKYRYRVRGVFKLGKYSKKSKFNYSKTIKYKK